MSNLPKFASLLVAVLLLSSCAATDCDPTAGGFIGAIRCDASGGYDKRIKEREDQHATLLTRRADLIREQQQIEAERRQVALQLRNKQAEQKKAETDLAAVQRQLAGAKKNDEALQQKAKALEADIADAKSNTDALAEAEQRKRARLSELESEQKALDKEYQAVTGGR
jgi:chromosome segregation ATPase